MDIITSQMIPINRSHVDTDLIIPAEFLRSISRKGFGQHLFARLRVSDQNFPLNLEKYQGAKILVARMNFGCGSSREHAAWALADWGIQVIIAQSFADIFHQNALNNQILPIVLPEQVIDEIFASEILCETYEMTVDLLNQTVKIPSGEVFSFAIDPYRKECLLHEMDDFDYLVSKKAQIEAFEQKNEPMRFFDTRIVRQSMDQGAAS
ncbi:MAG: 3-isopropylmalate dehydratase small subunit [Parachlamydia sp.]|nr:MAG: 3-isopropylmalate dehydratase small subunit [Parachlamydia sp.]